MRWRTRQTKHVAIVWTGFVCRLIFAGGFLVTERHDWWPVWGMAFRDIVLKPNANAIEWLTVPFLGATRSNTHTYTLTNIHTHTHGQTKTQVDCIFSVCLPNMKPVINQCFKWIGLHNAHDQWECGLCLLEFLSKIENLLNYDDNNAIVSISSGMSNGIFGRWTMQNGKLRLEDRQWSTCQLTEGEWGCLTQNSSKQNKKKSFLINSTATTKPSHCARASHQVMPAVIHSPPAQNHRLLSFRPQAISRAHWNRLRVDLAHQKQPINHPQKQILFISLLNRPVSCSLVLLSLSHCRMAEQMKETMLDNATNNGIGWTIR